MLYNTGYTSDIYNGISLCVFVLIAKISQSFCNSKGGCISWAPITFFNSTGQAESQIYPLISYIKTMSLSLTLIEYYIRTFKLDML